MDYPYGYVRWTEQRNMQAFVELVAGGRLAPSRLVTHRFAFDDALDAYQVLLGGKKEPYLGIVLEYGEDLAAKDAKVERRVDFSSSPANRSNPVKNGPVGVSFIGCGNFAKAVLLPTLKKTKGAALRGICTASGMSCGVTGKKEGFAFAATDQDEVLKDEGTVLVVVTTRHDLHAAQISAARRGSANPRFFCKHVSIYVI